MTHSGIATAGAAAFDAIKAVHEAWLAAELRGDVESILRLCTPDIVWLPPGRPGLEGHEAGRQLLQSGSAEVLDIRTSEIRVQQSGDLAVKTSRYETRYRTPGQDGIGRGTHLWVLRRAGLAWRVALVTWQVEQ